jgi:hypothetical protein
MSWTNERRQQQSQRIRACRPWEKSTGPRSTEGRAISSRNAYVGSFKQEKRRIARLINQISRRHLNGMEK